MTLPANLTRIDAKAFYGVTAQKVVVPSGCESIGSMAFAQSNVQLAVIPGSVTSIAADAFSGCSVTIITDSESSYAAAWADEHGFDWYVE